MIFFKLKIKKSLIFIFQTREKRKSNVSVDKKKGKTCEPLTEIGVMWPALKRVIWWCGPWCGLTQSALDILYVDWLGQPPICAYVYHLHVQPAMSSFVMLNAPWAIPLLNSSNSNSTKIKMKNILKNKKYFWNLKIRLIYIYIYI